MLEWLAGRWQLALEHAAAAYELGVDRRPRWWAGRVKALIEADLGLVDEARATADVGLGELQAGSSELFSILTLGVLGRLELALGNFEAAGRYLRDLPGRLLAAGSNDPALPVWADAIETLITLGELQQANAYIEPYELHSRRLGSPLAMEGVLRCRGLFAAAQGDFERAFEAFESALSEQPEPPWPLERARTLLCLGTVRRQAQQKKAAREALEQALAIFEELGARLWAEKARAELARIGGRSPSSDDLTGTEQRVAELAAQGRTLAALRETLATQAEVLRVVSGPTTVMAKLAPTAQGRGTGRAHLDRASGSGAVVVAGVGALPADRGYELWALRGDAPPQPAGMLRAVGDDVLVAEVSGLEHADQITAFAVSVEPSSGSPQPTGPIVLVGPVVS
jgi:tetratricopeptide (TPR) repeat protein